MKPDEDVDPAAEVPHDGPWRGRGRNQSAVLVLVVVLVLGIESSIENDYDCADEDEHDLAGNLRLPAESHDSPLMDPGASA